MAERIRSYGSPVIGSMSDFLAHTTLKEKKGAGMVEVAALHDLVADHEAVIRQLREASTPVATAPVIRARPIC